ncbi:type II toxin-antitoxin system HicB family antitoxin [Cardiobacterium sp. AH-315-I02]|nr:type II toxin-antitoxin system HicB family antitoxin [Cardiobacterium sp. AH-315-I02]
MKYYPVVIHKDENSCFGVTVPDIAGCFSAGDTLEDALFSARDAINNHLEILAEDGIIAPQASPVDRYYNDPDYKDAQWSYVAVDTSAFLGKTEKVTITLPKLLIKQIDRNVAEGNVKNRSAFLAESAIQALGNHG